MLVSLRGAWGRAASWASSLFTLTVSEDLSPVLRHFLTAYGFKVEEVRRVKLGNVHANILVGCHKQR